MTVHAGSGASLEVEKRSKFLRLGLLWLAILIIDIVLALTLPRWRSWSTLSSALLASSGLLLVGGYLRPGVAGSWQRVAWKAAVVTALLSGAATVVDIVVTLRHG